MSVLFSVTEPDLFYEKAPDIPVSPSQLANDFKSAKSIISRRSPPKTLLVGPDIATLNRNNYFVGYVILV